MPTPAQHAAKAASLLAELERTGAPRPGYDVAAQAHAALGLTAGTGDHYAAAESILARAETDGIGVVVGRALAHALLAER